MAVLINGNGNPAVYAQQDADLYAGFMGDKTVILRVGNEFSYEILSANTLRVSDGVILTKEGRRIQLDVSTVDEFIIPNGQQSVTNWYICGYRLFVDAGNSSEKCEKFVTKLNSESQTISEGTLRSGDTEVFISLYKIKQEGLLFSVDSLLLDKVNQISDIIDLDPHIQEEIGWNKIQGPAVSDWSNSAQTINGAQYYIAQKLLTYGYNDYLEMAIAPAGSNTLPTPAESTAFSRVNFSTWDKNTRILNFYAKQKPTSTFYLYVRGGR